MKASAFPVILLTVLSVAAAPAPSFLEDQGWRRQEKNGLPAFFHPANEAVVITTPAWPLTGSLRDTFQKALGANLGGKIISGGEIQPYGSGALISEYIVQETNGSRTWRAAVGRESGGKLEAALYATNTEQHFQKHHDAAMTFFNAFAGGGNAPAASRYDGGSTATQQPAAPAATTASAPAGNNPLVGGEWYTGRISMIQYRDTYTGVAAPTSGNNMTYKFKADGTYENYGLMQFTYSTCTNSYFMNMSGRYELDDDRLHLIPTEGTFDSRTCGGAPKRAAANKVEGRYRIRLSGNELTMTDEKGASSTYRRK